MDAIDIQWTITLTSSGRLMGSYPATGWDVHSKVAALKSSVSRIGWHVEAYPQIRQDRGPSGEAIGHREVIRSV